MPPLDALGRSDLFQPGQSFGKFYLVQLLGEGGTSRIFKALQQPINRLVAVKIPSFADDGGILTPDEFLSEATLMARLEHGHVVRIYDFGVQEDKAFICMEYVEGWNLQELIDARGPLSVSAALAAGIQTLEGLLYAHSQAVLHLDLSPANVLVAKSGIAKLSDFGMAGKKFRAAQGRIVGTPAFLSPEHVAGTPGTMQSDLFSFGSFLYYIAAGEPLFDPGPGNSRVTQAIREIERARAHPPEERILRLSHLLAKPVLTALLGRDAQALRRELLEAWKKAEGDERPEAVLKRELDLDGDPLHAGLPGEELPSGEALRERYFLLRESGKHREAVALLEKALRRQPENPLLQELLAAPAKAKSAPVTVLVSPAADGNAAPSGGPMGAAVGGSAHAKAGRPASRLRSKYLAGSIGILAVTAGILAWNRTPSPTATAPSPSSPGGSAAANPAPAGAATANVAAFPSATTPANAADRREKPDPAGGKPLPEPMAPAKAAAARWPSGLPDAKRAPRHRPPAIALSGPAGTQVTVDDTLAWIAPGPAGGRQLTPGLVNITLSPPGSDRPISSSLFVSEDTLYLLNLDAEGGFSVTRRRR
jgi:serine/threonine-protein kinase